MTQIKFSTNPTLTSDFPKLPAYSKSCLPDFKKREKKKSPRFTVYSKPENIFFLPFLNCHLLWDLDSSMSASLAWTTISLLHLAFTSIFSSSFLMVFHSMTLTWPTFLLFVSVYYFFSFFFLRYRRKCFLFVRRNLTPTRLERRWLNQEFLKYLSIKSIFYRESLNKMLHVFSLKSLPTAVCFFTHPLT